MNLYVDQVKLTQPARRETYALALVLTPRGADLPDITILWRHRASEHPHAVPGKRKLDRPPIVLDLGAIQTAIDLYRVFQP